MSEDDLLIGDLMEGACLTLEQVAAACAVEHEWLIRHIDEGLFAGAESDDRGWRFSSTGLQRVRRMWQLERDFEALPELAALVADMLEEMDDLRARLRRTGAI
jgi:chaperone modulatory protein CbpM